jgi:4-hydroxy-2-oxoheptanedioate aldolase
MDDRRIKARIGLWLELPEPLVAEAAARAGPDWIGLDLQHGAWDLGSAFRGIQLLDVLGIAVLVRVSEQELALIPRLLDHGAAGVIVAMASSRELVEEAVRRARYQPEGVRSFGGQRYGMRPASTVVSEIRPFVYPMIEDRRGVRLHVGPVDLGLGLSLDRTDPRYGAFLREIVGAAHTAGLPVAMHAVRAEQASEWLQMGFDELVLTADIELLRNTLAAEVAEVRRALVV